MMTHYTSLDEAVKIAGYDDCVYENIEHLKTVFVSKLTFAKGNAKLGYTLPSSKINTLLSNGVVETKIIDGMLKISAYDVARICINQELVKRSYCTLLEFISILRNKEVKLFNNGFYEIFQTLSESSLIRVVYLNPIDAIGKIDKFILKDDVSEFMKEYISLEDACKNFGVSKAALHNVLADIEEKCAYVNLTNLIGGSYYYKFVKKQDFILYQKQYMEKRYTDREEFISEIHFGRLLGLAQKTIKKALCEYHITPVAIIGARTTQTKGRTFSGRSFYHQLDFDFLLKEQQKLWEFYTENYYTSKEFDDLIKKELEIDSPSREIFSSAYFDDMRGNDSVRMTIPTLIRIEKDGRKFKGLSTLYKKEVIDQYIESVRFQRAYYEIGETFAHTPHYAYSKMVEHFNIKFPKGSDETKQLWESFVQERLENRVENERDSLRYARDYAQTTKFLVELLNGTRKDIAFMTTNELKVAIFNKRVLGYIQTALYSFLLRIQPYYVAKGQRILYDMSVIQNPAFSNKNGPRIKEVYSDEEYGAYCNFVNEVDMHKQKSIEDIERLLEGKSNLYQKYASVWLYVLIHLNNKWRRYEVTLFPRFQGIENTKLLQECDQDYKRALCHLKEYNLEQVDVQYVADKLRAFMTVHNKNKMSRDFTWTESTALAVSTAIVLCEIRCRLAPFEQEYLIDFDSRKRELPKGCEKAFFEGMHEKELNFNSLKMNRTLSSLAYATARELGNEAVMEVTRSLRNHRQDESTNIYLNVPQNRLDQIASNLFNTGPFGFVYTCLANILHKQTESTKFDITSNDQIAYSDQLKVAFGDWVKVEEVIRTFGELVKNQDIANEVLESMSKEQLTQIYKKINIGINHAKDEGFLCVFEECVDINRSCIFCPFMVMNFHTLTRLGEDFTQLIEECQLKFSFESTEAEKLYFTRLLTVYTVRIREAIERFGEEIVSMFFENSLDHAREQMKKLPSMLSYKTKLKELDSYEGEHNV